MKGWLATTALLVSTIVAPARGQEPIPPTARDLPQAPPPGGLVPPIRDFALGLGGGALAWDDAAPYDDVGLATLTIERRLWSVVRGRAGVAAGSTTLHGAAITGIDTWVMSFDLQLLVGADFGPFRDVGVIPYALGGVGSLVTNPTGDGAGDLPTRSQTSWSWGGGVRARFAPRWEARGEAASVGVRLADPAGSIAQDTDTIHNLRWEGSVQWLF